MDFYKLTRGYDIWILKILGQEIHKKNKLYESV